MKALTFKKQVENSIQAAEIEVNASQEISRLMIDTYRHILSAGNLEQFNVLNKKLTEKLNKLHDWTYPSLNGVYRQGFGVSTPPNILSTFRQFCQLELDQEDRDIAIIDGITAMRALIKADKEKENAANDEPEVDEKAAASEAMEEVKAELAEMEQEQVSPAHQQCIALLMQLDQSQVSAVTRYLGSLLQSEAA